MIKRSVALAVLVLVFAFAVPAVSASSASSRTTDFEFSGDTASDDIWVGMCMGANLNLSRGSEKSCQRKQRVLQEEGPYPYDEPNIEASLCMGVNLDITRAGAAKCGRKTAAISGSSRRTGTQHKKIRQSTAVVTQTTQATPVFQYAALGDSVAAGAGLPESNNPGDAACDRSTQSYAYHIAAARGFDFIHVACSGATMGDLVTGQHTNQYAQLDSAFAAGTPQLITITAGANNLRWDTILRTCLRGTCGTASNTRTVQNSLATLQAETQAVLQQIAQRSSGSPPQVIITGYYNPLSQNCATTQHRVTSEEITWVDGQLANLNQTLQSATASAAFATFVPLNFAGHDICSSDPWVQGPNDPSPLHPTATGQQAIAQMILADP